MRLALFDLDHTLLPIDSDYSWGEYVKTLGWLEDTKLQNLNTFFYQQYLDQKLDVHAYINFVSSIIRAQGMQKALQTREKFMAEIVLPVILPQARELVDRYQGTGYECVLVTATNDFIVSPIAKEFGFKSLIATNLAYDSQGELTGEILGTPSFQEGKVERVTQWLASKGKGWGSLGDSVFFSDSMNDLPLLEKVKNPVATNPDTRLAHLAQERDWEILKLFKP